MTHHFKRHDLSSSNFDNICRLNEVTTVYSVAKCFVAGVVVSV
jgi:hypothetical protein